MLPAHQLGPEQRRLLKLYRGLSAQDKASLFAFAEFLASRNEDPADPEEIPQVPEPKPLSRPAEETVVAAIRRLSESYFMLDRQLLFQETAGLMSAHLLQGRPAPEVIDELEQLFADHYQRLVAAD